MRYLIFFFIFFSNFLSAQVISVEPAFPKTDDDITIYYDAAQGNGALKNITQDIFAHTGLITSASSNGSDWKLVKTNWNVNDVSTKLTSLGNNLYRISFNIRKYYGVPQGTEVKKLAFVFRTYNANGQPIVGRDSDGGDIFYTIYPDNVSLLTLLLKPTAGASLVQKIGDKIEVKAAASKIAKLTLKDNGAILSEINAKTLDYSLTVNTSGSHIVEFVANDGSSESHQSFNYTVAKNVEVADAPANAELGATYTSATSVLLKIYAPNKQNVYVIGDFSNWNLNDAFQMKRSTDGNYWWIELKNLQSGTVYGYQYVIDGSLKIADPLSEIVLDPANDSAISSSVYPNMPAYPQGKTTGFVSILRPGKADFNWQITDFKRPNKGNLMIYELLLRDFLTDHSYKTLSDTLGYFKKLGINAIELMPIQEFENNNSWGYNPSFHNALDKYYGSPELFKQFIDNCHKNGIAVLVDVVFNHAFGQSPLCRLYWDTANNRPAIDNPWLNVEAKHPFNVGYDFNHESLATRAYVKRCLEFWLKEYKIDGFRFDLAKGFTQKQSNDDSVFRLYDASRIAILKDYHNTIQRVSPGAYTILELFSENKEETELVDAGMMVWGNMNYNYNEATMGWEANKTNFNWGVYTERGWTQPNLITYMESHDEERLMYKNKTYGNSLGAEDVKILKTGLKRTALASVFFYTLPGAKMLWQFGELGYDYSINYCQNGSISDGCRVDIKPIRWDYYRDGDRRYLYDVTRALLFLRNNYSIFSQGTYKFNIGDTHTKTIHLEDTKMKMVVLGNFSVTPQDIVPTFQQNGKWYEYFSSDSLTVTNTTAPIRFRAGEFRLYSTQKLKKPADLNVISGNFDLNMTDVQFEIYPNPATKSTQISYFLEKNADVRLDITDIMGKIQVIVPKNQFQNGHYQHFLPENLPSGVYFVRLTIDGKQATQKIIK